MQYLVQMRLANSGGATTPQEGVAFIEGLIIPTLELAKKLESEKKILAGGPVSGAVALTFVVSVESPQELDEMLTSLPVWPRMETEVTPLTTFEGRRQTVSSLLVQLKKHFSAAKSSV